MQSILLCLILSLVVVNAQAYDSTSHSSSDGHKNNTFEAQHAGAYPVLDMRTSTYLDGIIPLLSTGRVVFVGESHAKYSHHRLQFEVIKRLHQKGLSLAIGMEMFQQPMQGILDRFTAGDITEAEMLKQTDWFNSWKYDYRLYRDIVAYAGRHGIPIIALNAPQVLVEKVSQNGLAGLSETDKAQIPQAMDFSNREYQRYLEQIYNQHAHGQGKTFNRFVEVQLLWDEFMAQSAARYLQQKPKQTLVVLAGSGHIQFGHGIPSRLKRRLNVPLFTLLPSDQYRPNPGVADFLVTPEEIELPSKGMMGIYMEEKQGGILVSDMTSGSAAGQAGVKKGDLIVSMNGQTVITTSDVKIAMLDKKPGDKVVLALRRQSFFGGEQEMKVDVILGGEG